MPDEEDRVSLRHYIETLMAQYKEHHAREHELLELSVEHAREALDVRLESMNQFRAQILGERGSLASKETLELYRAELQRRIVDAEKELANQKGRQTALVIAIGVGFTVLQIVISLLK